MNIRDVYVASAVLRPADDDAADRPTPQRVLPGALTRGTSMILAPRPRRKRPRSRGTPRRAFYREFLNTLKPQPEQQPVSEPETNNGPLCDRYAPLD